MATHSVFLPEEFHEQGAWRAIQPMGHKESDMTEQLTHTPVSCVKVHLS